MHIRFLLCSVGLAIALLASGCSKNSSSPTSPQTAPTFPSVTVKGPNTTSSDSHAQLAVSYAAEVNAVSNSGLFASFTGLKPAQSGNTWTWSVSEATLSVTFSETLQGDGSYTWSWTENGTNSQTHVTYNNWVFFTGNRSADNKNGEWKIYNDNSTNLAADFTWSTNASSVQTSTLVGYNTSGVLTGKVNIIDNSDNSGEVDYYTGTVMTFKATWVAAGTGTWWTYDSTTGSVTGTGTWS